MRQELPAVAVALAALFAISPARAGVDVVARVRFTTEADADAIQRAACSADTRVRSAPVSVRVERKDAVVACTPGLDSKRTLVVHIGEPEGGKREVVIDMDLGEEPSLERANEVLDALSVTSVELERRLPPAAPRKEALSPTLTTLGIVLGGVGLGAVIASYIWTAALVVQPRSCSDALSVQVPILGSCVSANDYLQTEVLAIAGYATIALGATFALVGQLHVSKASGKSARFVPVIAPLRGGATGGFTLAF